MVTWKAFEDFGGLDGSDPRSHLFNRFSSASSSLRQKDKSCVWHPKGTRCQNPSSLRVENDACPFELLERDQKEKLIFWGPPALTHTYVSGGFSVQANMSRC